MLRKFLLTAGIAAGVFGLSIGMSIAIFRLWGIENAVFYYTVGALYYTAFYLAPVAFLVGLIGSIVCAVRSMIVKRI
jgi:uncharacterized membrane protein SpoIIM required for sporulation